VAGDRFAAGCVEGCEDRVRVVFVLYDVEVDANAALLIVGDGAGLRWRS
jgi:hypothetical protein